MNAIRRKYSIVFIFILIFNIFAIPTYAYNESEVKEQLSNIMKENGMQPNTKGNYRSGDCWNFANDVSLLLFNVSIPGGTNGRYYLTTARNNSNWECIGSINGSNATKNNIVSLLKKAKPGDIVQQCSSGTYIDGKIGQHTAVVYEVTSAGITFYDQAGDYDNPKNANKSPKVYGIRLLTYSWDNLTKSAWNGIGEFYTSNTNHGISVYRFKNYDNAKNSEHTHSFVQKSNSYYEAVHPHRVYETCLTCGETRYTGETITVSSCSQCKTTEHTHNFVQKSNSYYEAVHPHRVYETCLTCGETRYTGNYTTMPGCSQCE